MKQVTILIQAGIILLLLAQCRTAPQSLKQEKDSAGIIRLPKLLDRKGKIRQR